MSAPPLTILPQHSGANFAELQPLLRLGAGDKNTQSTLADALRERYRHYKALEEATWKEMVSAGEEVALFLQGKQFLTPNPFRQGGWIPYKVPDSQRNSPAVRRALSIMQTHVSGNLEKWVNSNPDIRVRPGVEADGVRESAEAARIVVDHYEEKFYQPRNTIAECLEGLTYGSYLWRLRLDPTLKSVTTYRQIFENREVKIGPGWGKCGDCGKEGSASDFNEIPNEEMYTCPQCHSEAMVIPPATGVIPVESGREPVELGDFRLDLVPFAQCRWDLRFHADESPWLIIKRRTFGAALRQILGDVKLPGGSDSDFGLDSVDRLAYSGQARAGYARDGKSSYKDAATVEEFWMSPAEYGDIILQKSTDTVSGGSVPTGKRLGDVFNGRSICVLGTNDMSTILGVFLEDHRDYIAQGKWYAKAGTGAGRGLQDLTEVQKVFNSDHQQTHTYLRSIATPAMLVATELAGEEGKAQYIGTPGVNIPYSLAALAEGKTPDQFVRPAFQPQGVPAQFFEFTYNRLSEFAQFASHFMPFASGLPGVDNRTATGANITQAATNALYTPVLAIKGEVRKLVAEKLVKLYPKHFPVDRYFPLGGKYGAHTGRWLKGSDLDCDLVFEVVQDSWLPKNSYQKQQAYASLFQMLGGAQGYTLFKQADPQRADDLVRALDLDMESETQNVVGSLCFRRVQQMKGQAGLVQDPLQLVGVMHGIDPATGQPSGQLTVTGQGAIQPPVSQAEPSHEAKRQWLMEWLDSDDGLSADPVLRQAIETLILLHSQLATQQASYLAGAAGQIQVAGQAPQAQAQMEMQAAQGQQQLQQQGQQMGLDAVRAVGEHLVAQNDLQNERDAQEVDAAGKGLEQGHTAAMNDLKAQDREHALSAQQARREMRQG